MEQNKPSSSSPLEDLDSDLDMMYFLSVGLFRRFSLFRRIIVGTIIFGIILNLIIIPHLLATFDTTVLINYGPTHFILLQGMGGNVVEFIQHEFIETHRLLFLSVKSKFKPSEETEAKIRSNNILMKRWMYCTILFVGISAIAHMITIISRQDIYYTEMLIRKTDPEYWPLLYFLFASTIFVFAYGMIACPTAAIYLTLCNHNQVIILNDVLEGLSSYEDSKKNDYDLVRDEEYQKFITTILKRCMAHHAFLKEWQNSLNDQLRLPMIAVMLNAIAFHISVLFNLIVIGDSSLIGLMGVTLLGAGCMLTSFIHTGQIFYDQFSNLSDSALNTPWTGWNIKNQKMLLMLLINNQEPAIFGITGLMVINYEFALIVGHLIMSIIGFFKKVVNNN